MRTHHAPCVKSRENDAGTAMILYIMTADNEFSLLENWLSEEHPDLNDH
jgi:hypothetical protein